MCQALFLSQLCHFLCDLRKVTGSLQVSVSPLSRVDYMDPEDEVGNFLLKCLVHFLEHGPAQKVEGSCYCFSDSL